MPKNGRPLCAGPFAPLSDVNSLADPAEYNVGFPDTLALLAGAPATCTIAHLSAIHRVTHSGLLVAQCKHQRGEVSVILPSPFLPMTSTIRALAAAPSRSPLLSRPLGICAFICAALSLPATSHAVNLLAEDFLSGTLDEAKWTTILPNADAAFAHDAVNGSLTTLSRAILGSVGSFTGPYTITGTFTPLHEEEHFNVGFRTDLSLHPDANLYGLPTGLLVSFVNDGNGFSIQGGALAGVARSYAFETGQTYTFQITDFGNDISVTVSGAAGTASLSAQSTFGTGNQIALYSREFSWTGSTIGAVSVDNDESILNHLSLPELFNLQDNQEVIAHSTPEGGSSLAMGLFAAIGLMGFKRWVGRRMGD